MMKRSVRRRLQPPAVSCIREVRVPVTRERWDRVWLFYHEILGLPPWPADEQIIGGVGFGNPRRGLYLQLRHDPTVDSARRRLTVVVPSLAEIAERLQEADFAFSWHHGFGGPDQWLTVADPDGHLVEVRQAQLTL
jgi:hypothetical protein